MLLRVVSAQRNVLRWAGAHLKNRFNSYNGRDFDGEAQRETSEATIVTVITKLEASLEEGVPPSLKSTLGAQLHAYQKELKRRRSGEKVSIKPDGTTAPKFTPKAPGRKRAAS